jgi:acyl carrier protein
MSTTLTDEILAAELEGFIRERFRVAADDPNFDRDSDVWEEGYVDSAGAVEVFAFLESKVGARLPEELLFEPEFVTIRGMARLTMELSGAIR